jgi:hypothetical protein
MEQAIKAMKAMKAMKALIANPFILRVSKNSIRIGIFWVVLILFLCL